MTPEERDEFLKSHRLCIVGFCREGRPPSLSPVYYFMDGGEIVISTTATRAKGKALRRRPDVSVCVLHEQSPFPYLTVYGKARVEEEGAVDVMMRVGEKMTGNPVPESMRPALEERARKEQRVVLRITPGSYFPR